MECKYWTEIPVSRVQKECLKWVSLEDYLALITILFDRDATGMKEEKRYRIKWGSVAFINEGKNKWLNRKYVHQRVN